MSRALLEHLENLIRQTKPDVANALQPGLIEDAMQTMLRAGKVGGNVYPILSFFGWRNGCEFDSSTTLGEASPFPESIYGFLDFKTAIEHFGLFHETLIYHPKFDEADGRYFPLFWDSSNSWIALDLDPNAHGRVVLLITESEELAYEAYSTLEAFIQDAIQANSKNEPLTCF